MIPTEDIIAVTQNVLGTMLQYETSPCDGTMPLASGCLTGRILINGQWNGSILFQTSEAFATNAAGRLMMMDSADVVNADRVDTLAELTNMIGGNIKSIVPGPSSLSLPTVSVGSEVGESEQILEWVDLNCEGDAIRVVICKQ